MKSDFLIAGTELIRYDGSAAEVVIPDEVTVIGWHAFQSKSKITSITMPDSVVLIGKGAFAGCRKLKNIVFSENLEEIQEGALADCSSLAEITFPDSLKKIGMGIFEDCDKLKSIKGDLPNYVPDENPFVTRNGSVAGQFFDDSGLLVFAGTVFAFSGHSKEKDTIIVPEGVERIFAETFKSGEYWYERQTEAKKVILPSTLKYIGDYAFANCMNLESVEMPAGVTVGANVFNGCKKLAADNGFVIFHGTAMAYTGNEKHVVVPEETKVLAANLFANRLGMNPGNKGIESIILPESLEEIGEYAFKNLNHLESMEIPEGVRKIGKGAFEGCNLLSKVTLPETLEERGEKIFYDCPRMADEKGFLIDQSGDKRTLLSYYGEQNEIEIPDGVTTIGESVFYKNDKLSKVILPDSVELIKESAFEECRGLKKIILSSSLKKMDQRAFRNCTALEEIYIPDSLIHIGKNAFENCKKIGKINIPNNLLKIGEYTFSGCESLKTVECDGFQGPVAQDAFDKCPLLKDENGMTIVAGYCLKYTGEGGDIVVPEGVTEICENVFREGSGLNIYLRPVTYGSGAPMTSVVLPSTLKRIRTRAFAGCSELKTIVIPEGVEQIGTGAFQSCTGLQSIHIPSTVTTIESDVFKNCENLSDIFVDEKNTVFGSKDGILTNASGDTLIYYPAGKKTEEYTIPEHFSVLGEGAFADCTDLHKVVIPSTVSRVEAHVFPRMDENNQSVVNGKISQFAEITVYPNAGAQYVGEQVFDFGEGDEPLLYPELSIHFIREQKVQVRLALGYCLYPDEFKGEYKEEYAAYAQSHEKTLKQKSIKLKLSDFSVHKEQENGEKVYKPDLSIKKPSELAKVQLLEEVVQLGTLNDLNDVLNTYKTFEMTARALGIAARYRGVEFVNALMKHGASFSYDDKVGKKYRSIQRSATREFRTKYELMIIPEHIHYGEDEGVYSYTPMWGISYIPIQPSLKPLSEEKRNEIALYFHQHQKLKANMAEMLMSTLTHYELEFADSLMNMGVDLGSNLRIVTEGSSVSAWNDYVYCLAKLKTTEVLPVLQRFHNIAEKSNKKLKLTQNMFESVSWNDQSMSFIFRNMDISVLNQKKALDVAVKGQFIGTLSLMAENGWLKDIKKVDDLIVNAQNDQRMDSLSWLIDYKNTHFDIENEQKKAEAKMMKELTEDPNSVSALKKIWGYKKLEDDTLIITSYKGTDTEVVVPAKIGKSSVSTIDGKAFAVLTDGVMSKYRENRKNIISVEIPEGITGIKSDAFYNCKKLQRIVIPSSMRVIGWHAFENCFSLNDVHLPVNVEINDSFRKCDQFNVYDGECVYRIVDGILDVFVNKTSLFSDDNNDPVIPEGVRVIGRGVFKYKQYDTVILPSTLERIGTQAFSGSHITRIRIPKQVKYIGDGAFGGCDKLEDIYIPASVTEFGKGILGINKRDKDIMLCGHESTGVVVHTPKGSPAEAYMKRYSEIRIENDYPEEE